MGSVIVNRSSSNPSYYHTDGTVYSGEVATNNDAGVFIGGSDGARMSGIGHGIHGHIADSTIPDVMFKGLDSIPYASYGGDAIHRFNSDYADGVSAAIRSGEWNPVSGTWSTAPSGDVTTFAADTTNFIVFTFGGYNPDSSTI